MYKLVRKKKVARRPPSTETLSLSGSCVRVRNPPHLAPHTISHFLNFDSASPPSCLAHCLRLETACLRRCLDLRNHVCRPRFVLPFAPVSSKSHLFNATPMDPGRYRHIACPPPISQKKPSTRPHRALKSSMCQANTETTMARTQSLRPQFAHPTSLVSPAHSNREDLVMATRAALGCVNYSQIGTKASANDTTSQEE
jgi:hypothetical protein